MDKQGQRPEQDAHRALALNAAEAAERMLAHFEAQQPFDGRPRKAIAAARAWACGGMGIPAVRAAAFAAHAAARDARDPAAKYAARAAGHAAATAHVAAHARHAEGYAAKAEASASGAELIAIDGTSGTQL